MAKALVISKDVLNELKRLALVMDKDIASLEKAQRQYVQASGRIANSTAEFASALYRFALEYADEPALIHAKVAEASITTKLSSSVYYKIARLAFDDGKGDASQVNLAQVSKYGSLIQAAHTAKMSADDFAERVGVSIDHLLKKLLPNGSADAVDKIDLGRQAIARFSLGKTIDLQDLDIPDGFADGDDVELLARVENGKLVLYGVVPKEFGNPAAVLQRIGARELTAKRKVGDLFADIGRTIKLVTTFAGGVGQVGLMGVHDGRAKFLTSAYGNVAQVSFPLAENFLGSSHLQLTVVDWSKIVATVSALKGLPLAVSYSADTLIVDADIPDGKTLDIWLEKRKKPITIGRADGSKLAVDLVPTKDRPNKMPDKSGSKQRVLSAADYDAIEGAKMPKKSLWLATDDDAVEFHTEEKSGGFAISKGALNAFKSVAAKLRRLGQVEMSIGGKHMRLDCTAENDVSYIVAITLA